VCSLFLLFFFFLFIIINQQELLSPHTSPHKTTFGADDCSFGQLGISPRPAMESCDEIMTGKLEGTVDLEESNFDDQDFIPGEINSQDDINRSDAFDREDSDGNGDYAGAYSSSVSSYREMPFESEEMQKLLQYQDAKQDVWSSLEDLIYKSSNIFPDSITSNTTWKDGLKKVSSGTIMDILNIPIANRTAEHTHTLVSFIMSNWDTANVLGKHLSLTWHCFPPLLFVVY
jgi:hypothetical protein